MITTQQTGPATFYPLVPTELVERIRHAETACRARYLDGQRSGAFDLLSAVETLEAWATLRNIAPRCV